MALAKGRSAIRIGKTITDHTEGSLYVLKKFLPDFNINISEETNEEGLFSRIIEIDGIIFFKDLIKFFCYTIFL